MIVCKEGERSGSGRLLSGDGFVCSVPREKVKQYC